MPQWKGDGSGDARDLTFEKDKLALAVLIRRIYLGWQTSPENADEHGVPWHDRVISHSPEPVVLKKTQEAQCHERYEAPFSPAEGDAS